MFIGRFRSLKAVERGGITLFGAALRPVGAAGGVGAGTGPMTKRASEGAGVKVGIGGGGAGASC